MDPEIQVLYEDNHLLAINKPAGMLSQGDRTGDLSALDWGKDYIKEHYNKPGAVFLGLVHRLDRPASGVLMFARTSKAASRLSDAFRRRQVEKTYRILVPQAPEAEHGELVHALLPGKGSKPTTVVGPGVAGAQEACLRYRVIGNVAAAVELEVALLTGRKHQIRAQFSAIGCPLLGDTRYGSKTRYRPGQIALHAWQLTVPHPTREEQVTCEAPVPWG